MFSFFKSIPLDNFDFKYIDYLFVENRLLAWIGEKKSNGDTFNSLKDFFQENYIETQIKAFFWGMDTVPDQLNFTWISRLHHAASFNLKHEFGNPILHNVRKHKSYLTFPNPLSQMMESSSKASPEGIIELGKDISDLEDEETKGKVVFFIEEIKLIDNKPTLVKEITTDAETASKYYEEQIKMFEENIPFFENLKKETKLNSAARFADKKSEIDPTLLGPMMKIVNAGLSASLKGVGYCLLNRNPLVIRKKSEKMIKKYNESPKNTETEKLDAIINLTKGLLNLHVFSDGNGRLNAHQLLNILLIKNGLYPSLLLNNCFDAFTHKEIRERIREGMNLFREKCTEQLGMLKQYRELNTLPKAVESEFTTAIINNQIEEAKNICGKAGFKLAENMDSFTSCLAARMNWLHPEIVEPSIIEKIILSSIHNGNHELLLDSLSFSNKNKIALNPKILTAILSVANDEIFDSLINLLNTTNYDESIKIDFFNAIPLIMDPNVSLKIIDYTFDKIPLASCLDEKYIINLFSRQDPNVILEFMKKKEVNTFYQKQDVNLLTNKLNNIVKNRFDLTIEEKNIILSQGAKLTYKNPVDDFDKRKPKLH